jgi:restriction system protein
LPDFTVAHDVRLVGSDGIYQIDVLASYTTLGVKMMVLIECKHYSRPVLREMVQVLYDKMRATGAHKGILFSTAGFQDGAIEYALRHKIALN